MQVQGEIRIIKLADLRLSVQRVCGPIYASLCLRNTAPFEEMLQRWRAVGNTVSDLIGPKIKPQIPTTTLQRTR